MRQRFLTDAVAAGIQLDDVIAEWETQRPRSRARSSAAGTLQPNTSSAAGRNSVDGNVRQGGCKCENVRFQVSGEPLRAGLCHCADCRNFSGSAFTFFAIWPREAFKSSGKVSVFEGRSFCRECGSRVFSLRDDEAEVMAGALDAAPGDLVPTSEIWVPRREEWLLKLPWGDPYSRDRTNEGGSWREPVSD